MKIYRHYILGIAVTIALSLIAMLEPNVTLVRLIALGLGLGLVGVFLILNYCEQQVDAAIEKMQRQLEEVLKEANDDGEES